MWAGMRLVVFSSAQLVFKTRARLQDPRDQVRPDSMIDHCEIV